MDDITKMFNNLVSQSAKQHIDRKKHIKHNRWKYCVALAKLGWEAYDFEAIPSETENEVVIKWRKEGVEEIHLKLGFTDQRLWIMYLEEKQNEEDKKNRR